MTRDQSDFESKIFSELRNIVRKNIENNANNELVKAFKKLIIENNYEKLIIKIKSMQEFTENSSFMENIKLEWWDEYLTGNMYENKDKKILLNDFEGKVIEFSSIEDIYIYFIKVKNQTIWKPYHNVFTKIFVEWVVEIIIKVCNELSTEEEIDFISKSIMHINKEQTFEEYTKYKLNEHLNYYKSILQYKLSDSNAEKPVIDEKIFSALTKNDKIINIRENLTNKRFEEFFNLIKTIYSSIPYQIFAKNEAYFHSIFHVVLLLISTTTKSEDSTNIGRIDSSVELGNNV